MALAESRLLISWTMGLTVKISCDDQKAVLERLNRSSHGTLMETLGIEYVDVGEEHLSARMPVSAKVHQPMGILHGGATAALAESVGSAASALLLNLNTHYPVGLELSINHLRAMKSGHVVGCARLIHGGRSTHLWDIRITDEDGQLIAVSRLTMMILTR